MKYSIIILLVLLLSVDAVSQKKIKYEDALPDILSLPTAGIPISLKEYQAEDPDNVSIDFQLGVVYLGRFLDSDILTQFPYKNGNARKALEYLLKAQINVDEKEVKRHEELYINFGTFNDRGKPEVAYDTIGNLFSTYLPILREFVDKAPPIYEQFTRSFSHYDRAHKIYTELVGEFQTFNDLLLLYDQDMDDRFEDMKAEYNNAITAFNAYRQLIQDYPIGYDQQLKVSDLDVYRLDGLSAEINFLVDQVEVWDYAGWVDATRAYTTRNIDNLRQALLAEDSRVNGILDKAEADFAKDAFEPLDISKELLFTLRKFDLESVVESIFLYKEAKHDLIYQRMLSNNLDTAVSMESDRKLYLYGQMVNKVADADSLLQSVLDRNVPATHDKYGTFLNDRYDGPEGIRQFVSTERASNDKDMTKYVSSIREMLYEKLSEDETAKAISYRGVSIPFVVSDPVDDVSLTSDALTTHRIDNFDGSAFLAGIFRNPESDVTNAYMMGITGDGRVGWYKDFSLKMGDDEPQEVHTRIGAIEVIPGGVALLVSGLEPETGLRMNRLITLSESGEEQLNVPVEAAAFPRTLNYVERSNSLMATFEGEDFMNDVLKSSQLTVGSFDLLGENIWMKSLDLKGDVVDVLLATDGFVVGGNYNEITELTGETTSAGPSNNSTAIYLLKVTEDGEFEALHKLPGSGSFYASHLYKVSEDCLNLLGGRGPYNRSVSIDGSPEALHVILNRDLEPLSGL